MASPFSLIFVPGCFDLEEEDKCNLLHSTPLEDWPFGNVEVAVFLKEVGYMPDFVQKVCEDAMQRLIELGHREFTPDWDEITILYGRGSVSSHVDQINGVCLLTLLKCFYPSEDNQPLFDGTTGEFFQGSKSCKVCPGESLVFNDDEAHAWLCNGYWVFANVPLSLSS
jgi:hypothetical protein